MTTDQPTPAELEDVRRAAEDELERAATAIDELAVLAYDTYRADAVAHMRAELAVRVAERGPTGGTIGNLRREGYHRGAEDLRAALRLSAMVALVLVDRPLPGDARPQPRELAAGVIGGALAEHHAPDPVGLAGRLLLELERAGLAFTHLPERDRHRHARGEARRPSQQPRPIR